MDGQFAATRLGSQPGATRTRAWMLRLITLIETAAGQLHDQENAVQGKLLEAASLLRTRINASRREGVAGRPGRLLAWQVRKVSDYIDANIAGPILVADLSALVQRSEAHFSRSFKKTFGESPHSFVMRRRLAVAARLMLTSETSLCDIAQKCGFTDQAHLCKCFRQASGQTPAAWRRDRRLSSHIGTPAPSGPGRSDADALSGRHTRIGVIES